jgi:hypothetical protein
VVLVSLTDCYPSWHFWAAALCVEFAGTLADLLGIVESVLYAKRLPDGIFNLAFQRAANEWPRQTAAVTSAIKANARWTMQQDEQVRVQT